MEGSQQKDTKKGWYSGVGSVPVDEVQVVQVLESQDDLGCVEAAVGLATK